MRVKIADLITELYPKYEYTIQLAKPFLYDGDRQTDIRLSVSDEYLESLMKRAAKGVEIDALENFAFSCKFNVKAIKFKTMLIHSSALIYDGGAYLLRLVGELASGPLPASYVHGSARDVGARRTDGYHHADYTG